MLVNEVTWFVFFRVFHHKVCVYLLWAVEVDLRNLIYYFMKTYFIHKIIGLDVVEIVENLHICEWNSTLLAFKLDI